jgi:hypothetical protein
VQRTEWSKWFLSDDSTLGNIVSQTIYSGGDVRDQREIVGPYVPKHWLVWGQVVRTVASAVSACGTVAILGRVFGAW